MTDPTRDTETPETTDEESPEQKLEKRLLVMQAARKARAKAGDTRVRMKELEERIKLEEMAAELGDAGRDFDAVFSPRTGEMIAVRAPKGIIYQRFRAKMLSPKGANEGDMMALLRGCLVYPKLEVLDDLLEGSPGMLDAAVQKITDLAGNKAESDAGK